jgi:hypothetical protein
LFFSKRKKAEKEVPRVVQCPYYQKKAQAAFNAAAEEKLKAAKEVIAQAKEANAALQKAKTKKGKT